MQAASKPVSAASGAVGSVVGQLARIKGARAVGVAAPDDKCRYVVEELGFVACVSHRSPTLRDDLKAACPNGVDVYFENVGGPTLDAALSGVFFYLAKEEAAIRENPAARSTDLLKKVFK